MNDLQSYLKRQQKVVDRALSQFLPSKRKNPSRIHEAMRYSVFIGGKRLRPILAIVVAEMLGRKVRDIMPAACALELIHTYSLVHDDLPSMDNDDLRRGQPTNHKVYGEDMAILAGDALLTHAFELIAESALRNGLRTKDFYRLIRAATVGAGTEGMIGGQVVDISSDKGRWHKFKQPQKALNYIHEHKTAALIQASLVVGGLLSKASDDQLKSLKSYGFHIGMAFQIQDDILDQIGDKKKLGKKGSDQDNQKLTYVTFFGLTKSQTMAKRHVALAHKSLETFGTKAMIFHQLADFIVSRDH